MIEFACDGLEFGMTWGFKREGEGKGGYIHFMNLELKAKEA